LSTFTPTHIIVGHIDRPGPFFAQQQTTMTMTSEERFSQHMQKVLKGISAPISTGGRIALETEPTITLKGCQSSFTMSLAKNENGDPWGEGRANAKLDRQAEMLKGLIEKMPKAAFGQGSETKYDPSVRDALQMKAEDFEVNIPNEKLEDIKAKIKSGLQLETDIFLEPYSLNMYEKGGRFVKHKDTPRGDDMLGTLLICLPSLFTGGDFETSMGSEKASYLVKNKSYDWEKTEGGCYDWWKDTPNSKELPWCAFFADVDHEIKTVTGGVRVTMAYLIRRKDSKSALSQLPRQIMEKEQASIIHDEIQKALGDETFLKSGGKIGYPCMHLYTNKEVFPSGKDSSDPLSKGQISKLKGRDLIVANAAASCSLDVYIVPYLSHDLQEDIAPYKLSKFPKKRKCPRYMSEEDVGDHFDGTRDHRDEWDVKNQPYNQADLWMLEYGDEEQAKLDVGSCDNYNYEGYYGNEASYTSFYVEAALHIEVPDSFEREDFIKATKKARTE